MPRLFCAVSVALAACSVASLVRADEAADLRELLAKTIIGNGLFNGFVSWDIDPDSLAHKACHAAGRNLSRAEWATYFSDEPYEVTCPEWPAAD